MKVMVKIVFFLLLAMVFLTSCAGENLPSEPGAPGETKQTAVAGRAFYAGLGELGYAQPTKFFINKDSLPKGEALLLSVQNEDYIYKYYYISVNGQWLQQTFSGEVVGNSNWIKSSASASLATDQLPEGDNYVVAYSCSLVNAKWDCHGNKWQIHQFEVLSPKPKVECSSDMDCQPNYQCKEGKCAPVPEELKKPLQLSPAGEVFVGPLAGWKNAKTDYGAVGDSVKDDTAALQAALNDLQQMKYPVLYIPAGTYRITNTLTLPRDDRGLPIGIKIVGEDPATTKIVWDGPIDGSMFLLNPNGFSLGRLTFDGKGKAGIILEHGPKFSAFNEYFDLVLQDAGVCLEAGKIDKEGITDSVIVRSTFLRCSKAGVFINNFNSLQWEIYDSLFKDNYMGVATILLPSDGSLVSGAGNFHVYQSVFMNSTHTDIALGSTVFSTIRDSFSLGSNAFYLSTAQTSPFQHTLQRNVILDPKGQASAANNWLGGGDCYNIYGEMKVKRFAPICIGDGGTLVLLDNIIRARDDYSGTLVQDVSAPSEFISIGNTYTVEKWFGKTHPVSGTSLLRSINDKIVARNTIADAVPRLPSTPPKISPPIFEVPSGADAVKIQEAIDKAVKLTGQKPVVHLPPGIYPINKTLVIPPNTDVQLLGEGFQAYSASILQWVGKSKGPVMRIDGPSKAVLRDVSIGGKKGAFDGLVLTGIDQPQGRVRANQVFLMDGNINFFVDKLKSVTIEFLHSAPNLRSSINTGKIGYKVVGPGKGQPGTTILLMGEGGFGDVTYDVENANVLVRDAWTESRAWASPKYVRLRGDTTFTLHNFFQDHPRAGSENVTVLVDNIKGKASFIGGRFSASELGDARIGKEETVPDSFLDWVDPEFESTPTVIVQGNDPAMKMAVIGGMGEGQTIVQNKASAGEIGQLYLHATNVDGSKLPLLNDWGKTDDSFLLEMFEQTRRYGPLSYAPTAPGLSDIVLHRVWVDEADTGIMFTPSYCGNKNVEAAEQCDDGSSGTCAYGLQSCQVCSAQCNQQVAGLTSFCGDNKCDPKHESTISCQQDCGTACPSENLVSWWPAEGNALDLISENNGELMGDTAFAVGAVGRAFSFDGSGDFVNMGDPFDGSLDMGTNDFTVVFWAKASSDGIMLGKGCPSCVNQQGYNVQIGDRVNSIYFSIDGLPDGGQETIFGFSQANVNQWHHYAGVFDRDGSLSMYVDGQLARSVDIRVEKGLVKVKDVPFLLGAGDVKVSNTFKGLLDEIALWKRTLSANEVQALYQAGSKGMCKP